MPNATHRLHAIGRAMSKVLFVTLMLACADRTGSAAERGGRPYVLVLGIAQDGGVPQAGCHKSCCTSGRHLAVASLALVDPATSRWWLFDATPDFPEQLALVSVKAPACTLAGVFLTHAHMGHYTGLMHLGREAMGASHVPVWGMPRMREYLTTNGPWSQLVRLGNIEIRALAADSSVMLGDSLSVTPFTVPHRDEYSETVGFRITGPRAEVAFVPDIDKWERWDRSIEDVIANASVAYLDGTFFDAAELPGRDMREIPHPFIVESLARFAPLPAATRARVRFMHLNHTNRAGVIGSAEQGRVQAAGCRVANPGERTDL
jgi:pyrroloquinoline quinone biosynthesis protein B